MENATKNDSYDNPVPLEVVTNKDAGAGPRKGRKSIRWDRDPEILYRLEQVAIMHLQTASLRQIAEAMGYSHTTAKKDVERVYTLWQREAAEKVENQRLRSIANYRFVQAEAFSVWRELSADDKKKTFTPLRVVMEAEREIMNLQGTKAPEVLSIKDDDLFDPKELTDEQLAAIAAGKGARKSGGG